MNDYITAQILHMKKYAKTWALACKLGMNDGEKPINPKEKKALKRIAKAVDRFTRDLERI